MMLIDGVTNADAIPVLERVMQFAATRHQFIAANIANLSTPDYQPTDLSVSAFQEKLREQVDQRRERHGNLGGALDSEPAPGGGAQTPIQENILFHDRNDRDLDRTMQDLVENFMTFRLAAQLMRNRFDLINTAIRERI